MGNKAGSGNTGVYRAVLAVRDARLLISASAASQLGDWLYNAALLGYVYEATGSATWVAAATICRLLPYVLLSPVGGMIADRYDKRTVLLVGDWLRLVNMLALAAVVGFDAPVGLVIALTALASAFGTAQRPAAMAMLPRLVGEARLGHANALLHTVQDLGVVVGPAIGAVLLAVSEPWIAFAANAGTFAISAALVTMMQHRAVRATGHRAAGTLAQLGEGLRAARSTPYVVPLFLLVAMVEFTYGAQTVQLVLYARNRLDFGSEGYGYLLALVGVGGLISAAINGRLASSTRVALIAVTAAAATCLTQLAYAVTDVLVLASIVTLIGGIGIVSCEVVAETALARVVKADVLGRVMGVFDALSVAAMVLGALLAPMVTAWTSLRGGLAILGLASLAVTLLCPLGLRGLEALSRQREERLASRLAVIEALPITVGAPRVVLEQLASAAQICPLPAGVDVVVQGAPAHAFYAVIDGSVVVHRDAEEVIRLGPGDHFGERGLLDNAPRNATVTTLEDSTIMRLDGDVMLDALRTAPSVLSALDRAPTAAGSAPTDTTAFVDDPQWGGATSLRGATVAIVGAGYPGKRRALEHMAALGVRLVVLDELGHWSAQLVEDGIAAAWLPVVVTGDADVDAQAVLDALAAAGERPDGVTTIWELSTSVTARVARALDLPGNPPESIDSARSKLRTRQLAAELGLPSPRAQRVRSLDELFAAALEIGFPAVVKPEFGANARGCVRVDTLESLPGVYSLVRDLVTVDKELMFRAGNDLLLEEYLDGVEFDVDLVMHQGKCAFASVSQNWPTLEPAFQETGLHCPPDHDHKAVSRLVEFCVATAQAFGLGEGVLHIEAKVTSRGPRIVEVNARMGGGRIFEIVRAVWGVDLIEELLANCVGLPPVVNASRKPRAAAVNTMVYAPCTGRLESLPIAARPEGCGELHIDGPAEVGEEVDGPDRVFSTLLADVTLIGKDLKHARALTSQLLAHPPVVVPAERVGG